MAAPCWAAFFVIRQNRDNCPIESGMDKDILKSGFRKGRTIMSRIRDIGLNSEQLIFRSESGEELKKIVLDILKHTESTTSNLYYLQGRLYDFFSVLTKDVVIDTYLGN